MNDKIVLKQKLKNGFLAILSDEYRYDGSVVVEADSEEELEAKINAATRNDEYIWRFIHGHPVRFNAKSVGKAKTGRTSKCGGWNGKKPGKRSSAKDLGKTNTSDANKNYRAQGVTGVLKGDLLTHNLDKNGKLKPARELLHRSIVREHLKGVKKPSGQPTMTFLGGGSAAGKSTFTKNSDSFPKKGEAVMVDSDAIKGKLPEYRHMVNNNNRAAAGYAHEESSAIAKRVMDVAQKQGYNVVLDGTGDNSVKSMMKKIQQARDAGLRTKAEYCTVPTEVALERSRARAAKTGREIDEDVIRNIHRNVSQIVPKIASEFDECNVWDTSSKTPKLIATCKRGEDIKVIDQNLWDEFVAKGNE